MSVSEHGWVDWCEKVPAHPGRIGGPIRPRMIVWHDTDTAPGTGPAIVRSWHVGAGAGNCAHFVIAENGHVTQMVPVTANGNHAGGQDHGTIDGMHPNIDTVGVEMVSPGFGHGTRHSSLEVHLTGLWTPYTDAQLNSARYLALELGRAIRPAWGKLKRLVHVHRPVDDPRLNPDTYVDPLALRHYDINPTQKTDPGPLFPARDIASAVWKALDEEQK